MQNEWWRESVGYQIYIRSFKDSNGDGVGDLGGIIEKLEYIKDLGVDFIWICPFYDSPMDDNGYDIKDYYKVAKEYGSMSDLKKLISKAHTLGLRVIIDLVMNHTSDENMWFKKSIKKIDPYTDFYIWRDGRVVDGKMCPPNNWVSFFSGSAWKYNEKRGQYFLKIFSNKMPDINYESEVAFDEMEKVIEYYGDLGVDGFRVDAIAHIGKDLTFADARDIRKTYKSFSNMPNAHKYLKRFNKCFKANNMVTMGELGGDPTKKDLLMYTTQNELDMVFTFEQMGVFKKNHRIDAHKLYKTLKAKYDVSNKGGWSALFWLNHDYPRLISKIDGEGDSKNASIVLSALMYLLKGTPIIYNGEEIGMENYPFASPSDFKDINAKMIFDNAKDVDAEFEKLKENTRDHSRTIMQWDNTKYAGFSTHAPWTYVNTNYKRVNVIKSIKDKNSILNNYKGLLSARKDIAGDILDGKYSFFRRGGVLGYKITLPKDKGYDIEVIGNLSAKPKKFNQDKFELLYSNKKVSEVIESYQVIVGKRLR